MIIGRERGMQMPGVKEDQEVVQNHRGSGWLRSEP